MAPKDGVANGVADRRCRLARLTAYDSSANVHANIVRPRAAFHTFEIRQGNGWKIHDLPPLQQETTAPVVAGQSSVIRAPTDRSVVPRRPGNRCRGRSAEDGYSRRWPGTEGSGRAA